MLPRRPLHRRVVGPDHLGLQPRELRLQPLHHHRRRLDLDPRQTREIDLRRQPNRLTQIIQLHQSHTQKLPKGYDTQLAAQPRSPRSYSAM